MHSGNKLPKADKFIKNRKKLKLWHRLLLFAGSIVVFITTYMLILPAITAEIGTLQIYDECVSPGGAVIEDITEIQSVIEDTTQSTTTDGEILEDGVIIDVDLDKMEDDGSNSSSGGGVFKQLLKVASGDGVSIITTGNGEDGSYVCKYDPETGEFEAGLKINFTIPQNVLSDYTGTRIPTTDGKKSYVVDLPPEIIVPSKLLEGVYDGQETGTSETAFRYCFEPVYDEEGNVVNYQIVMVYLDSYLDKLDINGELTPIHGTVEFNTHISVTSYDKEGNIVIKNPGYGFDIVIDKEEIEFNDNETILRDVTVSKQGTYNSEDKTITYQVVVYSKKGTGDSIVVNDTFSKSDFLTALGAELEEITYKQGLISIYESQWGNYTDDYNISYTDMGAIPNGDSGSAYYTKDENGNMTITIPGLAEATGNAPNGREDWKAANAYVITYKYKINPQEGVEYSSGNTAVAKIHDDIANKDIQDSATANVTVSGKKMVNKTGAYISSENKIKWTISIGNGESSLSGYSLTDAMFANITEEELIAAIKNEDGTPASADDYTITKTESGVVIGIVFNEGAKNKYTIEYKTDAEVEWDSQIVKNDADLTKDDITYSGESSVYINGGKDCFTKTFDSATDKGEGIYELNWTSKVVVPESGIPSGLTFTDIVSSDGHYMTSEQAQASATALTTAWNGNIINFQFYSGADRWNTDESLWVSAENLSSDAKYYRFRYTVDKPVVKTAKKTEDNVAYTDDEIAYTYQTTADVTGVVESRDYYNELSIPGLTKSANWNYTQSVVKYGTTADGNLIANDNSVNTKDGLVTWVVRVNLNRNIDSYKITDTLPAGVSLSNVYITKEQNYNYLEVAKDDSVTSLYENALNIAYSSTGDSTTGQVVTLDANITDFNKLNNYVFIKYVCKIEDPESVDGEATGKTYDLRNTVNVTVDGEKTYGSADQTTTVTWEEETTSDEKLTKDAQFDKNNNKIQYSIDINPNGEMYSVDGEEFSDITLVDTLSYWSYPKDGIIRDATLIRTSLKLYYAETNEDGSGKIGLDGKLINSGRELDPETYRWSRDVTVNSNDWGDQVIKNINLTLPNGTPIIFKYEYVVKIVSDMELGSWQKGADVDNKATVYVNGTEISQAVSEKITDTVEDSGTSGSADAGAGYTIYKVDKDNFSLTLPNAVFDLYVYNAETDTFENKGSCTTAKDGSAAIKGVPVRNENEEITHYEVDISGSKIQIPINTICYFIESVAPEGYKLDTNKRYFYFGKTSATLITSCAGQEHVESQIAENIISSHVEYITNEHSNEYYAEKTNLTVVKNWLDEEGNNITMSKADGSIAFKLYRVFTSVDGTSGTDPEQPDAGIKLNWTAVDNSWNGTVIGTGSVNCKENSEATVTFSLSYGGGWTPEVVITDTDTGEEIVHCGTLDDISHSRTEFWDENLQNFTAKIPMSTKTRNITIKIGETAANVLNLNVTGSAAETLTEETTEETTSSTGDGNVLHEHNFSDDIINEDKTSTINPDGFFTITGNLADDHGTAVYKVGNVLTTLTRCLKMETKTNISFNATKSGLLTLVFNTAGRGDEAITNGCKIDGHTYSASNNKLSIELEAGEHTITKQDTCYLFYMSFEEGGTLVNSNYYAHSFNEGKNSSFYNISNKGSTATNKGNVTYNDEQIGQCYKMNSKAEITFNAPKPGTVTMVLTNPNNASAVGAKIDGVDHFATLTEDVDSKGNPVYLLTSRISDGEHTITRINGTEVMLYYIEYTPDDYGDEVLTDEIPNNPNAVLIDEYTIGPDDGWAKSFTNLPWQVLDDNGKTLGYYSYYVVEVDGGVKYKTQYMNNTANGISSGTIGIYNTEEGNATSVKVIKKWLDSNGNPADEKHSGDTILFDLCGKINLHSGATLDTTKTESHVFKTYDSDFYNIVTTSNSDETGFVGPFTNYGSAKYKGVTYSSCLKMEGATSIKFSAPAKGKMTLVFGKNIPNESYGGLGFKLIYNGTQTSYAYDAETGDITGDCTVSYGDDGTIFTVNLSEGGEYEIKNNGQCYLFYMDYTYRAMDATNGIVIGKYSISVADNWEKEIKGLPLYIKDDEGNVIGNYSYYIVETSPNSGYDVTLEYVQKDGSGSDLVIADQTLTAGTVTITNQEKVIGVELPETGGKVIMFYAIGGTLLLCSVVYLLYILNFKRRGLI